jgi:protein-L-isoaspartate(D-aspartate) O-methyltransferase
MFRSAEHYSDERRRMIRDQLERRGIKDDRVIAAFDQVPRHEFVLPQDVNAAYEDYPLPIGFGQTISQPYIVAYMVEQLRIGSSDTVLEIGTGSGYAAAIMAHLAKQVYTLEVVKELYERATKLLSRLHYSNVECRLRDGHDGLPEKAPFDKIILSASPEQAPKILLDQLKVGGLLIAPLGSIKLYQRLSLFTKMEENKYKETELMGVSFVEMV